MTEPKREIRFYVEQVVRVALVVAVLIWFYDLNRRVESAESAARTADQINARINEVEG